MNKDATRILKMLSRLLLLTAIAAGSSLGASCRASGLSTDAHFSLQQPAAKACTGDAASHFSAGESALKSNRLNEAEREFRAALACHPHAAAAYVDLGVVAMRRKQWTQALSLLQHAERLAPKMSGIRLDVGLVYYREGDYKQAIPALRSVERENPSTQARYLLGLCYFFTSQYTEAAKVLEQNWQEQSSDFIYLYALGISAQNSGDTGLGDRAFARMLEIGGDSPEFHLLKGKAYLERAEPEHALPELEQAAKADPNLPFVHFNLGWAYAKLHQYDRAKSEFLKDIAIEPDVPYNYEQLGAMYLYLHQDAEAERYYKEALARDPRLPSSLYGLGKIYEQKSKYPQAIGEWQKAERLAPDSVSIHYALARAFQHVGKTDEAKREFAIVTGLEQKKHADEISSDRVPSPELKNQ